MNGSKGVNYNPVLSGLGFIGKEKRNRDKSLEDGNGEFQAPDLKLCNSD